jgi:hypothetical protein
LTQSPYQLKGRAAVITTHCAVFGTWSETVREFQVSQVRPHDQYPISVSIDFVEPKKRRGRSAVTRPDNIRYRTIEVAGRIVYDTRTDVPCDMAEFEKTLAKTGGRG